MDTREQARKWDEWTRPQRSAPAPAFPQDQSPTTVDGSLHDYVFSLAQTVNDEVFALSNQIEELRGDVFPPNEALSEKEDTMDEGQDVEDPREEELRELRERVQRLEMTRFSYPWPQWGSIIPDPHVSFDNTCVTTFNVQ